MLVIVSVNVVNHVIMENMQIIKIVGVEKKIYKLVEECSENIDGNEILYNETLDVIPSSDNKTCDFCVVYIILFSVFLIISISMAIYVYFFLYLKNRSTNSHYFGCLNINGY